MFELVVSGEWLDGKLGSWELKKLGHPSSLRHFVTSSMQTNKFKAYARPSGPADKGSERADVMSAASASDWANEIEDAFGLCRSDRSVTDAQMEQAIKDSSCQAHQLNPERQ